VTGEQVPEDERVRASTAAGRIGQRQVSVHRVGSVREGVLV
jgi:hypothetical protein